MTRWRTNLLALWLALAIFAAGVVVGFALHAHRAPTHDASISNPWAQSHAELLEAFRAHLHLDDQQVERVREIMGRTQREAMALHATQAPAFAALHERAHRDILELLTPAQAEEYRGMIDEFRHRQGPDAPHQPFQH